MQPRTQASTATDGGGRSGYPDRPHSFTPLTCYFRVLLAAVVSAHLGRTRRELRWFAGGRTALTIPRLESLSAMGRSPFHGYASTRSSPAGLRPVTGAAVALKEDYRTFAGKARARLDPRRNGGMVLAEHEKDPVTWEAPLPKALKATVTDSDADLIAAARALLALADEAGSGRGEYIVHAWGSQGVQIGDNNRQDNTFGAP